MPELLDPPAKTAAAARSVRRRTPRRPAGVHAAPHGAVVLREVSWEAYLRLRDEPANDRTRFTYDARTRLLEIEMPG